MVSSNFEHRVDNLPFNLTALEIQAFLAKKFSVSKVRIPKKEVKQTISGEETVEFDLLVAEDGSIVKANITVKPSDSGGGKGPSLTYSADFSGLFGRERTKAIEKFNKLIIENQLSIWPANTRFNVISFGRPDAEADKMLEEQMLRPKNRLRFEQKGIDVFINGKSIISNKNKLMPEAPDQRPRDKRKPGGSPKSAKRGTEAW